MKKYPFHIGLLSFLLLFCMSACTGSKAKFDSEDKFTDAFLHAIRKNDEAQIRRMALTRDDTESMIRSASTMSEEEKAKTLDEIDRFWPKIEAGIQDYLIDRFRSLHADAERMGLDWSTLKEVSREVKGKKRDGHMDVLTCDVHVTADVSGHEIRFKLEDLGKVARGWVFGGEGFRVRGLPEVE
ncbi:MAG: hypothetical protein AAF570_26635 [Bacteroidota bacterium]